VGNLPLRGAACEFSRSISLHTSRQKINLERIDYEEPCSTHLCSGCDCFCYSVPGGLGPGPSGASNRTSCADRDSGSGGKYGFPEGSAVGTQNYICQSSATGFFWKFVAPQATLFINLHVGPYEITQQIATHFLSPNPVEGGTPRPTWQGSADTSVVWGKAVASSTDPAYNARFGS